jgi:arylsulfatase A-like enzyme
MDQYIGEVLDHLDRRGLADQTVVIYQPDHGHSTETRAFGGGGNPGPYRGAKFSLFEGGIRVPAVIRYPNVLPAGETRDQFLTGCDWLPTLAELCEVDLPDVKLDGVSIVDVLASDAPAPRTSFYWQMGRGKNPQWAVRDGRWKLIGNPRDTTLPQSEREGKEKLDEKLFLVDLEADIGEQSNLVDQEPGVCGRLLRLREQLTADFDTE